MKRSPLVCLIFLLLSTPLFAEEIRLLDIRLTQTTGQVTLMMDGVKGTPLAGAEMPLEQGDVIITGADGKAELSFDEGTLVRLQPNSFLTLREVSDKKTLLRLRRGVILSRVHFEKETGQQFSVLTQSAIASVRGTEFVVDQTGAETWVGVLNEGHVAVQAYNFKRQVIMHFNQEVLVKRGSPPGQAHVLTKLYPHKVQMAEMRDRIKQLHRSETALSPQQRALLRTGWKQTQTAASAKATKPVKITPGAKPAKSIKHPKPRPTPNAQ